MLELRHLRFDQGMNFKSFPICTSKVCCPGLYVCLKVVSVELMCVCNELCAFG
jgi:hypothetical protein